MQPFADPHKKTVFKVFDLSNDLKHDDSVEEIKENSTFEVVKGNVRKPLMSIENSSYITIAGFDVAGDIDLKNTRNITVVNSRAGNIRGHNAKKNLIIGSKVGGKKLSIMTDLELEITEDNKVLIKKDGTEVFQLISDAIPLIENFTGKLYAILNGPKA